MNRVKRQLLTIATAGLIATSAGAAVDSPFEIDIKELDGKTAAAPVKTKPPAAKASRHTAVKTQKKTQPLKDSGGYARYTVKKGDHIFKILMRHFGMSNAAAEALIPEVIRLNQISDIRNLTVGRTILIPARQTHSDHAERNEEPQSSSQASPAVEPPVQQRLSAAQRDESPTGAAIAVRSITSKDPAEVTDAILNILAVKPGKDHFLEAAAAKRQALRLGAKVDRFFESNGKLYMVSLSAAEPFSYTVYRLLELEGIKLIRIDPDADLRQVAEAILTAMEIPYLFGEHAVLLNDRNRTSTNLNGFIFTRESMPPRRILLTGIPVAALTAELLDSKGKDLQ